MYRPYASKHVYTCSVGALAFVGQTGSKLSMHYRGTLPQAIAYFRRLVLASNGSNLPIESTAPYLAPVDSGVAQVYRLAVLKRVYRFSVLGLCKSSCELLCLS
jgi:hypothetical protein